MQTRAYKTLTIKIPRVDLREVLEPIMDKIQKFFAFFISGLKNRKPFTRRIDLTSISRHLPRFNQPKKFIPAAIVLVTAAITIAALSRAVLRSSRPKTSSPRFQVAGAKSNMSLNQEFDFPLTDSKGKKLMDIKFALESAELRDEIIIKGKRATAIEGRTFLILSFKIVNDFTKAVEINSKDYFRLTVNDNQTDMLAPDIHNDPVVVQPKSTKYVRIGWPINDTDTRPTLSVGEIEKDKTQIELNLQ